MAAQPPVTPRKRATKRVTRIMLMIVVPLIVAVVALRIYVAAAADVYAQTTESYTRRRWDAAIAPDRTSAPASTATAAMARTAMPSRPRISFTPSRISLTRIAEMLGNLSVTAFSSAVSTSGAALAVAIWVCGAPSNIPGEKIMTKLIDSVVQSISRRVAIRADTSRPKMLTVIISPILRPNAAAARASNDTSGGPL